MPLAGPVPSRATGTGKHELPPSPQTPNASAMDRSQRVTPVRMPPRPSTGVQPPASRGNLPCACRPLGTAARRAEPMVLSAGDPKRLPAGSSPPERPAAHGRPKTALPTRDSAELRRQLGSRPKDGRSPARDAADANGLGLGLVLTGRQLANDHPLLTGVTAEEKRKEDACASGAAVAGEDPLSTDLGDADMDGAETDELPPRPLDSPVKAGAEEARILTESWLGSPHSHRSGRTEGADATLSPPSSQFASADASQEYQWSPAAAHATSSSADPLDTRKYDDDEDDDTVNQSLNASDVSRRSAHSSASLRQARQRATPSPTREPRLSAGSPRAGRAAAASPGQLAEEAAAARHKGTIAARAMMGRKRVYGAVVIQRWFRQLLQREAQAQRDDVRQMLRERRARAEEERQKRRAEEGERTAALRAKEERSRQAALEEREEEVERATQRLKRSLHASVSLPGAAAAAGARARSRSPLRESGGARSPAARGLAASSPPSSPPAAHSPAAAREGGEQASSSQQEQSLMEALRASVERSADLLGLVRGSDEAGALRRSSSQAAVDARRSGGDVPRASSPAEPSLSSARFGVEVEDGGAASGAASPLTPARLRGAGSREREELWRERGEGGASDGAGAAGGQLAGAPLSPPSLKASPVLRTSATSSPGGMSDVLRRRALPAPAPLAVAGAEQGAASPARRQAGDGAYLPRLGNMDAAAKELQSSILSFLDSVEADSSGVNASIATEAPGGGEPLAARSLPPQLAPQHGPRRALALPDSGDAAAHTVRPCPSPSLAARPPLTSSAHSSPSQRGGAGASAGSSLLASPAASAASLSLSAAGSGSMAAAASKGTGAPVLAAQACQKSPISPIKEPIIPPNYNAPQQRPARALASSGMAALVVER